MARAADAAPHRQLAAISGANAVNPRGLGTESPIRPSGPLFTCDIAIRFRPAYAMGGCERVFSLAAKIVSNAVLRVDPKLDACGRLDGGRLRERKMFELLDDVSLQTLVGHAPFDFAREVPIVDFSYSPRKK